MDKTLRDDFAAAALAGGLLQDARDDDGTLGFFWQWSYPADLIAERAYAIADAMLAERNRKPGKPRARRVPPENSHKPGAPQV